jgi:hypothetical protein
MRQEERCPGSFQIVPDSACLFDEADRYACRRPVIQCPVCERRLAPHSNGIGMYRLPLHKHTEADIKHENRSKAPVSTRAF